MWLAGLLEQGGALCPDAVHGQRVLYVPEHRLSAGKMLAAAQESDAPGIRRRLLDERLVPPSSGFLPAVSAFWRFVRHLQVCLIGNLLSATRVQDSCNRVEELQKNIEFV